MYVGGRPKPGAPHTHKVGAARVEGAFARRSPRLSMTSGGPQARPIRQTLASPCHAVPRSRYMWPLPARGAKHVLSRGGHDCAPALEQRLPQPEVLHQQLLLPLLSCRVRLPDLGLVRGGRRRKGHAGTAMTPAFPLPCC